MASIGWRDLFDLENDKQLKDAIKLIEKFDRTYEKFIKGTKALKNQIPAGGQANSGLYKNPQRKFKRIESNQ